MHEDTLFAKTPWVKRTGELVDHRLFSDEWLNGEAPGVNYELKPVVNPKTGEEMPDCYYAVVTLNNPRQFNSYTTAMVKGVISAITNASLDRRVKAVVFTGTGDMAFCTGGNTEEYSSFYALRPEEYMTYMQLFIMMVDSILNCYKPVICRINGMRVAGGQEIGMACDWSYASDLAIIGQAGPRHGSAAVGGSSDFLPHMLSAELAMESCLACEMWSAYKMRHLGLIMDAFPVLRRGDEWIVNPTVITEEYVRAGKVVLGEPKTGDELKAGYALIKQARNPDDDEIVIDFARLDAAVVAKVWQLTHLFPGCERQTFMQIRSQKAATWNQLKHLHAMWLGPNQMFEGAAGFAAFANRKATGRVDQIDWAALHGAISRGEMVDAELFAKILPHPPKE
ncbi:enoyl-CoA hydratase-related protein [Patescibacteria group bacterium]